MKDAGLAHMGVGRAAGKGKAEEAARMAISSPLLETSINGAHGVLINITGSNDIGLEEVEQAASLVQAAVHPDALTIFGATFDETLDDEIRVTVIATGFEETKNGAPQPKTVSELQHAEYFTNKAVGVAAEPAPAVEPAAPAANIPPMPVAAEQPVPAPAPAPVPEPPAPAEEEEEDDPFADIFKIFNRNN